VDTQRQQEAQAIIEEAKARKELLTVLVCRLEQSDDRRVKDVAAELRQDRDWLAFTRWYDQRGRRRIARKTKKKIDAQFKK
jgi:hypothetical protein